jgi:lysozyme
MKPSTLGLSLFSIGAVYIVYSYAQQLALNVSSGDNSNDPTQAGQMNSPLDTIQAAIDSATSGGVTVDTNQAQVNQAAFLTTIGYSEGADYGTLYGGGTFSDFSTHPNISVTAGNYISTAAGKYQILYKTWLYLSQKLGLTDFSPATQDAMALELISEKGALDDVQNGNFSSAIAKCAKTWASLPGSPYGQPTHDIETLASAYTGAGGINAG